MIGLPCNISVQLHIMMTIMTCNVNDLKSGVLKYVSGSTDERCFMEDASHFRTSGPFPILPLSAKSHHVLPAESVGAGRKYGHLDLKATCQRYTLYHSIQKDLPSRDRFRMIASMLSSFDNWFA